jgi:hypothetical protein
MMKSVRVLTAAAAVSVLAAPCLRADTVAVKAAIPFEFVVADRHLPSGEYRFVRTDDPGVVHIYSTTTREHVATVFCQALPRATDAGTRLAFEKHGSQHFLKTIRSEGGFGVYLPDTRSERQAQAVAEAQARALAEAHSTGAGTAGSSLP